MSILLELVSRFSNCQFPHFLRFANFVFFFNRSLTATFSGKIEFSVVSTNGEKVFRKKKSIKVGTERKQCYLKIFQESDTQIGRPMFGLLAAKFIPHKYLVFYDS